jgi:hypothetical protein
MTRLARLAYELAAAVSVAGALALFLFWASALLGA